MIFLEGASICAEFLVLWRGIIIAIGVLVGLLVIIAVAAGQLGIAGLGCLCWAISLVHWLSERKSKLIVTNLRVISVRPWFAAKVVKLESITQVSTDTSESGTWGSLIATDGRISIAVFGKFDQIMSAIDAARVDMGIGSVKRISNG